MQALVACNTGHPDDKIARAVSRCHPGRAAAVLTLHPGKHNLGRTCRGNFIGPHRADIVMKSDIRSLAGVIRDS
jgi:hypothetical protein